MISFIASSARQSTAQLQLNRHREQSAAIHKWTATLGCSLLAVTKTSTQPSLRETTRRSNPHTLLAQKGTTCFDTPQSYLDCHVGLFPPRRDEISTMNVIASKVWPALTLILLTTPQGNVLPRRVNPSSQRQNQL